MGKVYISGKVTGLPEAEYLENFMKAEMRLSKMGYTVVNPAKVNSMLPKDTTWEQYMLLSKVMVDMCDTIYMLSNYEDSKGALLELKWAKNDGLNVLYEKDMD
jgi:hypothetical protein